MARPDEFNLLHRLSPNIVMFAHVVVIFIDHQTLRRIWARSSSAREQGRGYIYLVEP